MYTERVIEVNAVHITVEFSSTNFSLDDWLHPPFHNPYILHLQIRGIEFPVFLRIVSAILPGTALQLCGPHWAGSSRHSTYPLQLCKGVTIPQSPAGRSLRLHALLASQECNQYQQHLALCSGLHCQACASGVASYELYSALI